MTREQIEERIASFHELAPGAICELIPFTLVSLTDDSATFRCTTQYWMRNTFGALHGGMSTTILDQAMSLVAHCVKKGEGTTPCIEMQVSFHRPIAPCEEAEVVVRTLSVTKSLIRMIAELRQYGKLCVSATGTYFQK